MRVSACLKAALLPVAILAAAGSAFAATRSIRDFTACDGRSDDTEGLRAALTAAGHNAFTLVVDCPVVVRIGDDVAKPIFVESGVTVQFSGAGQLIVDNSGIPAFIVANSSDVHLLGWRIMSLGGAPLSRYAEGYHQNGQWVAGKGSVAARFNDLTLTPWMAQHRQVTLGGYNLWNNPTNFASLFYFTGDDSNIEIRDMTVAVPDFQKVSHYVPMVFSFSTGYPNGWTTVKGNPDNNRPAVPHNITFSHITLDGFLMGFQGTVQNATFDHIRAYHYGDLQADDNTQAGGEGKWFAPPHLFYINADAHGTQPQHVRITNIIDEGVRVGVPRDTAQSKGSGNALSLKIGGNDIVVDGYISHRPDGFMDILPGSGLTVRNVEATYDSSFLNDIYPGIRFPGSAPGYNNVTLENVHLTDVAPRTRILPILSVPLPDYDNVVFQNVRVDLHAWQGAGPLVGPTIKGNNDSTPVAFHVGQ